MKPMEMVLEHSRVQFAIYFVLISLLTCALTGCVESRANGIIDPFESVIGVKIDPVGAKLTYKQKICSISQP